MILTERVVQHSPSEGTRRERYPSIPIEKLRVDDKTIFLFSGQGVQYVGMGQEIFNAYPDIVQPLYETADRILAESSTPFSIKKISFEGPEELLNRTEYAQLSILCYSQAYYRVLMRELQQTRREAVDPGAFGGPSSGGVSALVAAGASDFETTFRFVQVRAPRMQEIGDKSGYAVLWIASPTALEDIKEFPDLRISYLNSESDIVVCGPEDIVGQARSEFRRRRIISKILEKQGPYHIDIMESIVPYLDEAFLEKPLQQTRKPIYSNTDGRRMQEPEELQEKSKAQMTSYVNWKGTVDAMGRDGMEKIIVIGNNAQLAETTKKQREASTGEKQKIVAFTSRKKLVLTHGLLSEKEYQQLAA